MAKLNKDFVPNSTLDYLNKIAEDSTTSVVNSLMNKFKNEIAAGIKDGNNSKQIANTLLNNFTDIKSKASANAVARTALHGAYNHGVLSDTLKDPAIIGYRFVAIYDDRTTEICKSLRNKIIPKDEILTYLPPLHFNCRSTIQPIYITDKISEEDLISNFKKTQEYKDIVEPQMDKGFNNYHNEDIKKEIEKGKDFLKLKDEYIAPIYENIYDKPLQSTLDYVDNYLHKNQDIIKTTLNTVNLIKLETVKLLEDKTIKTKYDIIEKLKDIIPDINTRKILSEALFKQQSDISMKLQPKEIIDNISKGIEEVLMKHQIETIINNAKKYIPETVYNDLLKKLEGKSKLDYLTKMDNVLRKYIKDNSKMMEVYNTQLFIDYMKLQQSKLNLDKTISKNQETFMLPFEIIDRINNFYFDSADLIKRLNEPNNENFDINNLPDVKSNIKLSEEQIFDIYKKTIMEKYVNDGIENISLKYGLNTEQRNILENIFKQIDISRINYNKNPLIVFNDFKKLVNEKVKDLKRELKSPFQKFEDLFKTQSSVINEMLNKYLKNPENIKEVVNPVQYQEELKQHKEELKKQEAILKEQQELNSALKQFENLFNTKSDVMYKIINKYIDRPKAIEELNKTAEYIKTQQELNANLKQFNNLFDNMVSKPFMEYISNKYIIFENGKLKLDRASIDNIPFPVKSKDEVAIAREKILQEDVPFDKNKFEYFLKNWKGKTTSAQILKCRIDMVKMGLTKSDIEKALFKVIDARGSLSSLTPKNIIDNFSSGKDQFGNPINKSLLFSDENIKLVYKQNQEFLLNNEYEIFRSCSIPRDQYNNILNNKGGKNGEVDYSIFAIESVTDDVVEAMTFRAEVNSKMGHMCIFNTVEKERFFASYQASENSYNISRLFNLGDQNEMLLMGNKENIKYYQDTLMTELIFKSLKLEDTSYGGFARSIAVTESNNIHDKKIIDYISKLTFQNKLNKNHTNITKKLEDSNSILYLYNLLSKAKTIDDVDKILSLSLDYNIENLGFNKDVKSKEIKFPNIDFTADAKTIINNIKSIDKNLLLTPYVLDKIINSFDVDNINTLFTSGLDNKDISKILNNYLLLKPELKVGKTNEEKLKAIESYSKLIDSGLLKQTVVLNIAKYFALAGANNVTAPAIFKFINKLINKSNSQSLNLEFITLTDELKDKYNLQDTLDLTEIKYKDSNAMNPVYYSKFGKEMLSNNLTSSPEIVQYLDFNSKIEYYAKKKDEKAIASILSNVNDMKDNLDKFGIKHLISNFDSNFIINILDPMYNASVYQTGSSLYILQYVLASAAENNKFDIVDRYISILMNSNILKTTEIMQNAIKYQSLDYVKRLATKLTKKLDIIAGEAIKYNKLDILEYALSNKFGDAFIPEILAESNNIAAIPILKKYNALSPEYAIQLAVNKNNKDMVINLLPEIKKAPYINLDEVVNSNNTAMLQMLLDLGDKVVINGIDATIKNDNLSMFELISKYNPKKTINDDAALVQAIQSKSSKILNYILDNSKIVDGAILTAYSSDILSMNNLKDIERCLDKGMEIASNNDLLKVLNLPDIDLQTSIKFINASTDTKNIALKSLITSNKTDTIKYLVDKNKAIINEENLLTAIEFKNKDIVNYFVNKQIPSKTAVINAIKNGFDFETIKNMVDNNYEFDKESIKEAIQTGYNDIAKYLLSQEKIPVESEFYDIALDNNNIEIFDLLVSKYKMSITEDNVIQAVKSFKNEIVDIMLKNINNIDNKAILDAAVSTNNKLIIELMVNNGVVSAPVLNKVIKNKNNELFSYLVAHGFKSKGAFEYALEINDTPSIMTLIKGQKDITTDMLLSAVKNNNLDIVKLLADKVDYSKMSDNSILVKAAENNNLEMFKLIYKYITNITTDCVTSAVMNNNLDMFKFMMSETRSVNFNNVAGIAAIYNNETVIDYIIQNNIKINDPIILINAIESKNVNMVKKLISLGLSDRSAASKAMKAGFDDSLIIEMIDKGMVNNFTIETAATIKNMNIINALIDRNLVGNNILEYEILYSKPDIIKSLIDKGLRNNEAIIRAIKAQNLDLVKYIVEKNAVGTYLMEAFDAAKNNIDIQNYLIEKGVFEFYNFSKYLRDKDETMLIRMLNVKNYFTDIYKNELAKYGHNEIYTLRTVINNNLNKVLEYALENNKIEKTSLILNRAIEDEKPEAVNILLKYIQPDEKSLIEAVNTNSLEIVKQILSKGVKSNTALKNATGLVKEYLLKYMPK